MKRCFTTINNLYRALDTQKCVESLEGNKVRENSYSEIAKGNRAEWLGHAEKQIKLKVS